MNGELRIMNEGEIKIENFNFYNAQKELILYFFAP